AGREMEEESKGGGGGEGEATRREEGQRVTDRHRVGARGRQCGRRADEEAARGGAEEGRRGAGGRGRTGRCRGGLRGRSRSRRPSSRGRQITGELTAGASTVICCHFSTGARRKTLDEDPRTVDLRHGSPSGKSRISQNSSSAVISRQDLCLISDTVKQAKFILFDGLSSRCVRVAGMERSHTYLNERTGSVRSWDGSRGTFLCCARREEVQGGGRGGAVFPPRGDAVLWAIRPHL
ncbi:hypothetical protein THAOC_15679, partial [Thalassiosira oceanica]